MDVFFGNQGPIPLLIRWRLLLIELAERGQANPTSSASQAKTLKVNETSLHFSHQSYGLKNSVNEVEVIFQA